jgi:uncharacterized protein YegL
MRGEPIQALKVGVQSLISSLRQDPHALESVHISIIIFDNKARLLMPLESLETFQTPIIECPQSGATMTGAALELLCQCVDKDLKHNTATHKGDWRPLAFLMTDGSPNDSALYNRMVEEVARRPFATFVACAAGPRVKLDPLKKLTSHIYNLGCNEYRSSASTSGNTNCPLIPEINVGSKTAF